MERKEYKIFLPNDEQAGQLIDLAWKDFYEKAEAAGYGIVHDGVRKIMKDFFVSGYTYGYNDVLNIIRDQMAAEELAKGAQEDADESSDYDVKIIDLGFSVRVLNCLRSADIETLGDLLRVSPTSLLKLRNFGRKSLRELDEFFARNGYEWGSENLVPRDPSRVESKNNYIWSYRNNLHLPKKGESV